MVPSCENNSVVRDRFVESDEAVPGTDHKAGIGLRRIDWFADSAGEMTPGGRACPDSNVRT